MNIFLNIKLIVRNWWRNKLFFLISLFSLTAGLGCTNLLMTFFIHEYNVEKYNIWGIERSGFFNGREKWAKGFENQRV